MKWRRVYSIAIAVVLWLALVTAFIWTAQP